MFLVRFPDFFCAFLTSKDSQVHFPYLEVRFPYFKVRFPYFALSLHYAFLTFPRIYVEWQNNDARTQRMRSRV